MGNLRRERDIFQELAGKSRFGTRQSLAPMQSRAPLRSLSSEWSTKFRSYFKLNLVLEINHPALFCSMEANNWKEAKAILDRWVRICNHPKFIPSDPISIPHLFSQKEDIEIAALFSALLAWGQRGSMLKKLHNLMDRMDMAPLDFILHHKSTDLIRLEGFVHRTFNDTDLLYLISFLKTIYENEGSLEKAFFPEPDKSMDAVYQAFIRFRKRFVSLEDFPKRSGKHVASPERGSACKRLNMLLRWMVRKDDAGVDFGLWQSILPAQLICPCDVHVERQARILGLVSRPKADWKMAEELTQNLRLMDAADPVRYDFALFGMGVGLHE
jgi:uncharacterized protein (TIGR02757 family)